MKMVRKGCYLAWNLWYERNKFVFDGVATPIVIVAQRIHRQLEEFNAYSCNIYSRPRTCIVASSNIWNAPALGVVKINSDASLSEEGWVGMGAIARDSTGSVIFSAVKRVKAWWPPEIAEAKAILLAVSWARRQGLKKVVFESDAQILISRLSRAAIYLSDLDAILSDILFLVKDFDFASFSHVKRDGNYVAHHLAKVVPFGYEQCWVNHCPSVVAPYVLMDNLSMI